MPKVQVRVIAAKNLDLISEKGTKREAYQEPWVVVKLGRLTSTIKAAPEPSLIKKSANPQFNQLLDMEFDDIQAARLEVEIRDVDENNKEQMIGALRLRLQNLAKKIASVASYKLTVPHLNSSKAELELSLEAQDFDTSDGNFGMSGTSFVPGISGAPSSSSSSTHSAHLGASGGMPPPSASSAHASHSYPHAMLPSQSPISMPHQPPTRAAIQQYPPPVNYNAKDIKRIHPHIAKGSYGVVYKGTVPDVKEVVVIKDMDFTNQKALDDWRKEIKMMAKTSCEYVVRVLGYATADRTLTIVMELMAKGSLYDVLHNRKENLSVITRMRMARHCALGLQHLHDLKVMHRDIKSMNILVNESFSCKLTDFGCAKSLNDQGHILNTANSGTPLWMAPEVKMGHYDFSADIYSLGLVIYELLEKRLPQYDQIRAQVIIPSNYDSKDIVGPCLSPDPSRRPKASEIVHKLDCVIRNIITNIRKTLKEEELKELGLSTAPEADQLDSEISALYQILLKKDPKSVDAMVYQAFGSSPEKASANKPDVPMPQQQQQPFGMPGAMPFGMPMAPVGYPPGFQASPFPMAQPAFGQPAFNTPPFGMPAAQANPYMPNPYMQPKPRHHVQMINPGTAYQQPSYPQHAPRAQSLNPYAPPPQQNPYHVAHQHHTPLSASQNPYVVSELKQPSRSPSPPVSVSAPPAIHNALLVDDPYSDAYRRPESPATTAQAASIQAGRFDVMKPERSGQSLLDDLTGLSSAAGKSSNNGKEPVMDFGDFASPRAESGPTVSVSQSNADYTQLDPYATPVNRNTSPNSGVSSSPSRFVPLSESPLPTSAPVYKVHTDDASLPRSPSQAPKQKSASSVSVGTLIDMDLVSMQPTSVDGSQSQRSMNSNANGTHDSAYSSFSDGPPQAPSSTSLLDFLQHPAASPDVMSKEGIKDLLALNVSSNSSSSLTNVASSPSTQGSDMLSGQLIDMSSFLSAEPLKPSYDVSVMEPEMPTYSHIPASVKLLNGDDMLYPSMSPSPPPKSAGNNASPLAFASVQRQPPANLQANLRRCFNEFAAGSSTVDCGTAGIIIENVLPDLDGNAIDASFSSHLQRLGVKTSITEEMCMALFANVWNDCVQ